MFDSLIKAIQQSVIPEQIVVDGRSFTTGHIYPVKETTVATLHITTLSSLVDYIANLVPDDTSVLPQSGNPDIGTDAITHIARVKPTEVDLFSTLQKDGTRLNLITAEAPKFGFAYGQYMDRELFQVSVNQWFHDNATKENVLKFIGSMQTASVTDLFDDGLSQTVKTKKEVVGTSEQKIKPNVMLLPRDCFPEIQPIERELILRIKKDGDAIKLALFTAGDGLHDLNRVQAIIEYLEQAIDNDKVQVLG